METMLGNATFVAYAIAVVVLSLNLLFVWAYSGAVRNKAATVINQEDAATFKKPLLEEDPPEVRRVLRAHANAAASIYPFFALGLVFVLVGGGVLFAKVAFGVFVAARLLHTFAYLSAKQPWRTICFAIGTLVLFVIAGDVIYLLVRAA